MRKARVLITEACNRHCDGCCNKYSRIMAQMVDLYDIECLRGCDLVCVTGGEPMMDPTHLLSVIEELRRINIPTIYVYTALYDKDFSQVVRACDGIHFTLHHSAGYDDIEGLESVQEILQQQQIDDHCMERPEKSHRLYVDTRVASGITILPHVWSRVDMSPWLTEEEVFKRNGPTGLPPDEELYRLKGVP